jgi:hypothetical protein
LMYTALFLMHRRLTLFIVVLLLTCPWGLRPQLHRG